MKSPMHDHVWRILSYNREKAFLYMLETRKPWANTTKVCDCGETKKVQVTFDIVEM